jgi:predicted nucleic acid-binding protein
LNTDLTSSVRRFSANAGRLRRRPDSDLDFLPAAPLPDEILCDTTVYIDLEKSRFPANLDGLLAQRSPWHSTVVESELIYLCGRLDPHHPGTGAIVQEIDTIIQHWPADRVLVPDRAIWREAAILTGILTRLHHANDEDRGRTMNDALIFLTAVQHGCAVLSRNVGNFDPLLQLVPEGRAVFYRLN